MKKIFCFLLVLSLTIIGFSFYEKQEVFAQTENTFIEIENLNNLENGKLYKLKTDITLDSTWTAISLSNITLDGNGFCINFIEGSASETNEEFSTKNVLFDTLVNVNIKNLKIQNDYYTSTSAYAGLVANWSEGGTFENLYVSGKITVQANSAVEAGAIVGTSTGTIFKNCYSITSIDVTGTSTSASSLVAGGLVGRMNGGEISNCFVYSSGQTESIKVLAKNNLPDITQSSVVVGGLVGIVWNGNIINNYTSAKLSGTSENIEITPLVGLLVGKLGSGSNTPKNISFTHTTVSSGELIGEANGFVLNNCSKISDSSILKEKTTFSSSDLWDTLNYPWDFLETWNVKSGEEHLVLQVFESFTISLIETEHVEYIVKVNETEITDFSSIKFNQKVQIIAEIDELHKCLYSIKSLQKDSKDIVYDKETNSITFNMTAQTAGLYGATTQGIEYTLNVETNSFDYGGVRYKGAQKPLQTLPITMTHNGVYEIEAVPEQDYAFKEWVWVTMDGESEVTTPARLGEANMSDIPNDERSFATKTVKIMFDDGNANDTAYSSYVHIPNPTEIGTTYTLRAIFTSNVCNLKIRTTITDDCATISVNDIDYEYSSASQYIFQGNILRNSEAKIEIKVKEGYKFVGWQVANISDPIDSFLVECSSSDETINFQTGNTEFLLIANIEKEEAKQVNLTWLWWTLGGIGGAGVIGVVVWLIIRKARESSFMDYM